MAWMLLAMSGIDGDGPGFCVVLNAEEQYSIWWADRDVPAGWRKAGVEGTRQECLDHIERVWTDMRPLSLRRRMSEMGTSQ